jgi:RNA polymerase sigma-70 factor (ECF subfamily)
VEHREVVVSGVGVDRGPDVVAAYDAHERDLFTFTLAVTHDRGVAEDLVQESFLRLIREARAGRFPENPRAWLYRVVVNLARSRARRRIVADRWRSLFASRDVAESPEDRFIRHERSAVLDRALARMPIDVRIALLLASDGHTGQEVAALLGRSEGATRTLLWRARRDLRQLMQGEATQ